MIREEIQWPNYNLSLNFLPLPDSAFPAEDWLGGVQGMRARRSPDQQVVGQTPEAVVWKDLIQVYQRETGIEGGTTLRSMAYFKLLKFL